MDSFDRPEDGEVVIDLPDGQKLYVSHLPTGTVIEVATWRGTGRPDNSTHRLMLGVEGSGPPHVQPVVGAAVPDPWRSPNPVRTGVRQQGPVRPPVRRSSSARTVNPWLILLQVILVLGALGVAVWLSPFRLEHPRSGVPLAPGEVATSLVVVNTWTTTVQPGEAVLIRTGSPDEDPAVAVVTEASGSALTVTLGSRTLSVGASDVIGRAVLIVPYLGTIPTALGL